MKSNWNSTIILLSIAIAFIGSYGGITLYEQFRLCSKENRPKVLTPPVLLVLMALSLGGVAIWCMHFVGMAAMSIDDNNGHRLNIYYRIDLTIASLLAVIVLLYVGLLIASRDRVFTKDQADTIDKFVKDARSMTIQEIRKIQHKHVFLVRTLFQNMTPLLLGGLLTAAGVCVMHYVGMQALVIENVEIRWDTGIVAASVLIALVAATAAYWILFRLLALFPYVELLRVVCSAIMAIAVNGMHYTGMAAATFHYTEDSNKPSSLSSRGHAIVDQETAVLGALSASMLFIWIIFILCIADLRVWYYNYARIVREADIRMTLHKNDPRYSSKSQPFLEEYQELRSSEGDAKSIVQFRLKMKASTSPHSSSLSSQSQSQSVVVPTTGEATGDQLLSEKHGFDIGQISAVEEV